MDAVSIREMNVQLVRRALADGRPRTKTALARETGLSFPTVSHMVDVLVGAGELAERGLCASTGGRAAMSYAVDPLHRQALLLRLEGERLQWAVCDGFGTPVRRGAQDCAAGFIEGAATLIQREQARNPQLQGVAFGVAANVREGVVCDTFYYPELRGVSLDVVLQDRCGLPVAVENDVNAAAMGYWAAHRDGLQEAVTCVYCGAFGFGACTIVGGKCLRGAHNLAGEICYLPQFKDSPAAPAELVQKYAEIIRMATVLIDPERVVLYQDGLQEAQVEEIRAACAHCLPVVPAVALSDFERDYERGLADLAARQAG
ncbi:ROK family protein [Intestinibacillus massiliensis]|nr:ROK family protein [Intestinibacillus massiliensis]